jgi:Skp family chaperone for outer membrane proteins
MYNILNHILCCYDTYFKKEFIMKKISILLCAYLLSIFNITNVITADISPADQAAVEALIQESFEKADVRYIRLDELYAKLIYLQELQSNIQLDLNKMLEALEAKNKRFQDLEKKVKAASENPEAVSDEIAGKQVEEYMNLSQEIQADQQKLQQYFQSAQMKFQADANSAIQQITQEYLDKNFPNSIAVNAIAGNNKYDITDAVIKFANAKYAKENTGSKAKPATAAKKKDNKKK